MHQSFNKDLTLQEIYASGKELAPIMGKDRDAHGNKIYTYPEEQKELVATLHHPVLVSDMSAIMEQIKTYAARETALLLINKPAKTTEYEGTKLYFDQSKYPTLR